MEEVRQILSAYLKTNKYKVVARQLGISKNTVRKYIRLIERTGLAKEDIVSMDDEDLKSIIYPSSVFEESDRIQAFENQVKGWISELPRVGVTRFLLWQEYKQGHPNGFAYSQFCERLNQHIRSKDLTMSLKHDPAHEMMMDFAGSKLKWINRETGEVILAEVLVAVLPFSQYTFVIALDSQKTIDVVHGINQSLMFFGGTPHALLSDNFAAYVKKADRYEPSFTELCVQLGAHYHMDLQACRVAKPKDKASVENMVSTIYTRIYAELRNEEHYSLKELNAAIREKLDKHNKTNFQKKSGSRQSIFDEYGRALLRPLPNSLFELNGRKRPP